MDKSICESEIVDNLILCHLMNSKTSNRKQMNEKEQRMPLSIGHVHTLTGLRSMIENRTAGLPPYHTFNSNIDESNIFHSQTQFQNHK